VYFEGYSVAEKDIQKAIRWYRKAAKQGHYCAQLHLRMCYGVDVWGDWRYVVSAYAWHSIVLANHNREEHKFVLVDPNYEDKSNEIYQEANENFQDEIDKVITPAQIKKAEAMVKELTQNNPKLIQKKQGSHP
jgi:TPR repeat protein